MFMQEKSNFVKAKNLELQQTQEERSKTIEQLEEASEQLSVVAAELLDDQQYLAKLSQMCQDKAKTWDQRSKVRQDEIFTLTEVIGIIKGSVTEKTTARTVRFNQQGLTLRIAQAIAESPDAMEAVEADAEAADAGASAPLAFLQ